MSMAKVILRKDNQQQWTFVGIISRLTFLFLEYNFKYHKEYLWNISNMLFLFDQNYSISELEVL